MMFERLNMKLKICLAVAVLILITAVVFVVVVDKTESTTSNEATTGSDVVVDKTESTTSNEATTESDVVVDKTESTTSNEATTESDVVVDKTESTTSNEATTGSEESPIWSSYRLPRHLEPKHYFLRIHPNISKSTFKGRVLMQFKVLKRTDKIIFHAKNLRIKNVVVFWSKRNNITPAAPTLENHGFLGKHDMYYVKLANNITRKKNNLLVRIHFHGTIGDKMAGLYKSYYRVAGERRTMLVTEMEPIYARQMFPCLDEPDLKAKFHIRIVRKRNLTSLSNAHLTKTMDHPRSDCQDCVLDEFATTPTMSTYLVAIVVSDFHNISAQTDDGKTIRVFAPENQIYEAETALNTSVKLYHYFKDFFQVDLPMQKYDFVAVTKHTSGMENWGLVVVADWMILCCPSHCCGKNRNLREMLLAHEIAHQWIGNLVTMKWWDDIWLNEGLTSYITEIALKYLDDRRNLADMFSSIQTSVLKADSWMTSKAVKHQGTNAAEIQASFDTISYYKGAFLLRMIENVLGLETMKIGFRNYLQKYRYQNAETKDLWNEIQKATNRTDINVTEYMDSWVNQPGYPTVNVRKTGCSLSMTQGRFTQYKNPTAHSATAVTKPVWTFPFTFKTENHENETTVWVNETTHEYNMSEVNCSGWIMGNVGRLGLYRVNFDADNWKALADQLSTDRNVFTKHDRICMLDDALFMARIGQVSHDVAFQMLNYLGAYPKEKEKQVAKNHFKFIKARLKYEEEYRLLFGTSSNPGIQKALPRENVKYTQEDLDRHWTIFVEWKSNTSASNILKDDNASLDSAMKMAPRKDWKFVLQEYLNTFQMDYLYKLAKTSNVDLLDSLLKNCLNGKNVDSLLAETMFTLVWQNPNGQLVYWRFLKEHWKTVYETYGIFPLETMFKGLGNFDSRFDHDEIEKTFRDPEPNFAQMLLDTKLQQILSNAQWRENEMSEVKDWLKNQMADWALVQENYYPFHGQADK